MPRLIQVAALFGLGALVGTAADQIHVRAAVLWYPGRGVLMGQPPWVPLLFGGAGVLLPLVNDALMRLTRERGRLGSARRVAVAVFWFFAAYAATALLQRVPRLLAVALVLAWGARVALVPALDKLLAGPLIAIGGTLFEAVLSSTGAFHYRHPDLSLVPVWLPALYLHVSLMTREASLVFLQRARAVASRAGPPA